MIGMSNAIFDEDKSIHGNQARIERERDKDWDVISLIQSLIKRFNMFPDNDFEKKVWKAFRDGIPLLLVYILVPALVVILLYYLYKWI